jgi:hypothetical protein
MNTIANNRIGKTTLAVEAMRKKSFHNEIHKDKSLLLRITTEHRWRGWREEVRDETISV